MIKRVQTTIERMSQYYMHTSEWSQILICRPARLTQLSQTEVDNLEINVTWDSHVSSEQLFIYFCQLSLPRLGNLRTSGERRSVNRDW